MKLGRSYVSDGNSHLIDFQVNDVLLDIPAASSSSTQPATVKVTAQVAAHLDPAITAEARAIHGRSLEQKPYWDLERARMGETRKVPVEVIVNGQSGAEPNSPPTATSREFRSTYRSRSRAGSPCESTRRRTPTPCSFRSAANRYGPRRNRLNGA